MSLSDHHFNDHGYCLNCNANEHDLSGHLSCTPASQPSPEGVLTKANRERIEQFRFGPSERPSPARSSFAEVAEIAVQQINEELKPALDILTAPARSDKDAERVSDAMVEAYLAAQRAHIQQQDDKFLGVGMKDSRAACRAGLEAALAERAPSGESIDTPAFREKMDALAKWDDPASRDSLIAFVNSFVRDRRATAGTTAAPAEYLPTDESSEVIIDFMRKHGCGETFANSVRTRMMGDFVQELASCLLAEPATAGNAAPTEADDSEGGASALQAEPAGQHDAAFTYLRIAVDSMQHDIGTYLRTGDSSWLVLTREIGRTTLASIKDDPRCRAEGGVTCNNSSSELVSNTATTAPGDLTDERIMELDCVRLAQAGDDFDIDNSTIIEFARAIEREILASNASAAPSTSPVGAKEKE